MESFTLSVANYCSEARIGKLLLLLADVVSKHLKLKFKQVE